MAKQILTAARLRELLDYYPETGLFVWRAAHGRWGSLPAGTVVGYKGSDGYLRLFVDGVKYLAHRLVWLHVHGEWPPCQIDHIDGCRSMNAITNLRLATPSENLQNRQGAMSNNQSGILGVFWNESQQKWVSSLNLYGKTIHRKRHDTLEAAVAARRAAEIKYFKFSMRFKTFSK